MDELYDQIRAEVETLIAEGRALAADGLTWGEAWTLLRMATRAIVKIVESVGAGGADKRELALLCLDKFTAAVLKAWDIPKLPDWIEGGVDSAIHTAVMATAGMVIDAIVDAFNGSDWSERVRLRPTGHAW